MRGRGSFGWSLEYGSVIDSWVHACCNSFGFALSFPRPTRWAKAVRAAGGCGWEVAQVSESKRTGDFESLGVSA